MAHITGGGLIDNISEVLPRDHQENLHVELNNDFIRSNMPMG